MVLQNIRLVSIIMSGKEAARLLWVPSWHYDTQRVELIVEISKIHEVCLRDNRILCILQISDGILSSRVELGENNCYKEEVSREWQIHYFPTYRKYYNICKLLRSKQG